MSIYDLPNEKIFDATRLNVKISLWTKFKLMFVKKQFSRDFIYDNGEKELWCEITYKILKDKCYILKSKTYYLQRLSHLQRIRKLEEGVK